jgi:CDGSH iron-sulfur domain-containing protein 3
MLAYSKFIIKSMNFLSSMARLVRKEDRGPMEVKVGDASKWICMCGLSNNQPFCDSSHKKTADEEAGKIYRLILMEPELKFNRKV